MKILWLSHLIPYPPKGGVLQRSHHLLRELARHHEVDLLAFNQRALMKPLFPSLEAGVAEASQVLGGICRRIQFVPIAVDQRRYGRQRLALASLFGEPYTIGWLRSREYRSLLQAWLRDTRYDLVHFDTVSLVPYFDLIPPGVATALDHHNIESSMLLRRAGNESNWLRKIYYLQEGRRLRRYEREHCPKFTVNFTCSDLDTADLQQIAPASRVETIPNGVDIEYFIPGAEEDKLRLVFVGRLNWYPNAQAVHFIVEQLWPALKQAWPALEMDLIGANPPAVAVALGKRDPQFKVHGFVDDVRPIIARATVYICPITDGGGTKLKVLDALAMGKPLVAHPIACEGIEVVSEDNVLFAAKPEDYVRQLRTIVGDSGRRQSMARSARRLVESRYSYDSIGRQLAELFEAAVARDPT